MRPAMKQSLLASKNTVNIQRTFATYFTLKLKVQKTTNLINEMIAKAKQLLNALQEIDSTIVIYAFQDTAPTTAITCDDDVPTNINAFKAYFSGANPILNQKKVMYGLPYGSVIWKQWIIY